MEAEGRAPDWVPFAEQSQHLTPSSSTSAFYASLSAASCLRVGSGVEQVVGRPASPWPTPSEDCCDAMLNQSHRHTVCIHTKPQQCYV